MYTRGPVIRSLEAVSALAGIAAIVALVVALTTFSNSVYRSDVNSCRLITGILHSFHTPGGRAAAANILQLNPSLRDCHRYARQLSP